ncbi:DUF7534 family protein [Natrinema versiforme]|uniref:Uncharacterized protein n=1 Tax=Natrinema versiforme JCM 10478 TaxID=1227496 RepID=L9YBW5_9EURY|nr:hypothetical protein [Natrinema versiforme]ELY71535.1 hypothetical protein C489_00140 [Natrinema versiforme JCM 10478]
MSDGSHVRFLRTTVVLWILAVVLSAIVAPPDPFTQLLYTVPLLVLAPGLSYLLSYRGGFEYLHSKL